MITGFNTDVEHDGILYHVQTEDKGLDTPLILTLVYTRGEILASKRVRYDDLIEGGFDEKVLAQRLLRQHKLICAAVRAGRVEELKKMTERENVSRTSTKEPAPISVTPAVEPTPLVDPVVATANQGVKSAPLTQSRTEQRLPAARTRSSVRGVPISRPEPVAVVSPPQTIKRGSLQIVLVDERNYRGGDRVILRVRVETGDSQTQTIPGADVILKILGSTFRPLIYQSQTGTDGIASFRTEVPHFRSGRAAILIRANAGGIEAELRRIIQQG